MSTAARRAVVPATALARTRRARRIADRLALAFPQAHIELDFSTPLELAVATILSAQCTDVRVNMVTPALFARYRSAADYAVADRVELEESIRSTGFYRNKALSIIGVGQAVVDRFAGALPETMTELLTLPGFGRKTANVVLGNAFGVPGIAVDTHVGRLVRRWGLTEESRPGPRRTGARRHAAAPGVDLVLPTGDSSRSSGVPGQNAGLRRVFVVRPVPFLWRRPHRPGSGGGSGHRTGARASVAPGRPARHRRTDGQDGSAALHDQCGARQAEHHRRVTRADVFECRGGGSVIQTAPLPPGYR